MRHRAHKPWLAITLIGAIIMAVMVHRAEASWWQQPSVGLYYNDQDAPYTGTERYVQQAVDMINEYTPFTYYYRGTRVTNKVYRAVVLKWTHQEDIPCSYLAVACKESAHWTKSGYRAWSVVHLSIERLDECALNTILHELFHAAGVQGHVAGNLMSPFSGCDTYMTREDLETLSHYGEPDLCRPQVVPEGVYFPAINVGMRTFSGLLRGRGEYRLDAFREEPRTRCRNTRVHHDGSIETRWRFFERVGKDSWQ